MIILEVVVPSTGQVVSLGTRYPVAKTGGKGSSASIPRLASRAPSPLFPDIASSDLPGPADPALRVSSVHVRMNVGGVRMKLIFKACNTREKLPKFFDDTKVESCYSLIVA